ncbi:riboflavin biosynthesis protein RibD C-terminal domain protein [Leptospira broomii serovar Hurstbridge str. 5399]|uniref:Riboflavin biosynthesis protein RibD C-terminal domain protein n=1 Tax=Leptospira broomii serovar Hurstbridge str. 5399 TaxID=1049789 RepID=T0FE37_9LEPT|nr:dihydrofolate reductase family protein [Leptospira broomii]EQA46111.1 riboflavin biosynthesis protein RibD C-terminal domain protein [Leptospira broomii serovar Hurstbridge str. 5399]
MRKIILQMQMSVDGCVSAADSSLDWQIWNWGDDWNWDDRLKKDFNTIFESIDCILLSRKMIEQGYLNHWGNAARNFPVNPHYAFAKKIVDANKVVPTNKLKNSKWDRTEIVNGNLIEEVRDLKLRPGGNIITFGGVSFGSSLAKAGLIDEFQFFVNPTVVGQGLSLFNNLNESLNLKLIRSVGYDCGIVLNRYAPETLYRDDI